jgi:hypothetical protein
LTVATKEKSLAVLVAVATKDAGALLPRARKAMAMLFLCSLAISNAVFPLLEFL